ncbi:MAG: class I SAM-dependent methyltransferase, partial [Gammaproteobacteria bacterium]
LVRSTISSLKSTVDNSPLGKRQVVEYAERVFCEKGRMIVFMTETRHGKIPDWYNKDSEYEEAFNEDTPNARTTNRTIEKILKKYKVKTVLDLTCGTGSQVFWLLKRGYKVTGSDISPGMLKIAKRKAKSEKISIKFLRGDMRTIKVGNFDAAITVFNAIGHLTKAGFEKTMRNIHRNLNDGGIYLFDILNLSYVMNDDNITKLSLERVKTLGNTKIREIQHSLIDNKGILSSYTHYYAQKGSGKPKTSKTVGTLQLYTAKELREMLTRNGFKVLGQYGINGSKFSERETERIMTVARKK